jgi:hypothetical protein
MKRHGVTVRPITPLERAFAAAVSDDGNADSYLFKAFDAHGKHGGGQTEDDALESLAQTLGIQLWHEEAYENERIKL